MKLFKIILTILICVINVRNSNSECLACWQLNRVKIALINNDTLDVYIQWNMDWLYDENYLEDSVKIFPSVILNIRDSSHIKYIITYPHDSLYEIKYPKEGLLVTTAEFKKYPIDSLKSIAALEGIHNGYIGAGTIPSVSERIYKLLLTPPKYMCHRDFDTYDLYWLSYKDIINYKCFDCLCNAPYAEYIEYNRNFERNNLVLLKFIRD